MFQNLAVRGCSGARRGSTNCQPQNLAARALEVLSAARKPFTQFPDRDQAMLEVAKAVRAAAARLKPAAATPPKPTPAVRLPRAESELSIRSSNLRLAKTLQDPKIMQRAMALAGET